MASDPKKAATKTGAKKAAPKKATAQKTGTANKSAAKPAATKAAAPRSQAVRKTTAKAAPTPAKGIKMTLSDMTSDAKVKAGQLKTEAGKYADQASERAKLFAVEGKTKTAGAMDSLAKMIEDAAPQVDDKLGTQYGDFARTAAKTVSGLATSLEKQDVDELVNNTRDFVKKSPAVAIGTAAVVGFVLARMLKSGNDS